MKERFAEEHIILHRIEDSKVHGYYFVIRIFSIFVISVSIDVAAP